MCKKCLYLTCFRGVKPIITNLLTESDLHAFLKVSFFSIFKVPFFNT